MAKKGGNTTLAIGVGLNLDPLNQDIAQAASVAKSGMETVGTAVASGSTKAGDAVAKAADKVQSMRTQLRQATQDAQQMAEKYGVMSNQAIAAASKAGELKDKIGDINTVITAFSADSKFTVVAGALQQAAGAASIVTGSMALLGVQSKETEAMLLKVQGALALTQGLATIKEMGASFTALRAVIVGQVIPSLTAMGTAMNIALGVAGIALAAVITAVVMYNNSLDEEANALKAATEAQAANNKAVADSQKIIIDTQNLRTRAMKDGLDKQLRMNKDKVAIEQYQNELAYSQGEISASTFENRKIYIKQYGINEEEKIRKAAHEKELADIKKHQVNKQTVSGPNKLPGLSLVGTTFTPPINIDPVVNINLEKAKASITKQLADLNNTIKNSIVNVVSTGLSGLGEGIAAALSNEEDPFEAFGVAMMKSLGQMAVTLGGQLLAIGLGMQIVPGLQFNAGLYIAGGAALIVAGSAVSGLAGRKSKGGSSSPSPLSLGATPSGGNTNPSFYTGGNNSGNLVITGYVKGNDIAFVNGKSGSKNNRNLRFG